jgi:nitrate/nitrite-specific signal transduction histidine kinase
MKERAVSIGGRLEVTSEPGNGTTVRLTAAPTKEKSEQTRERE